MSMFIDYQNDIENNMELQAAAIAVQNDLFRQALADPLKAMQAQTKGILGECFLTPGVAGEGAAFIQDAITAVAAFESFTEDNDPNGEHEFGVVIVQGQKLFWRIDLYDLDREYGSDRPFIPAETCRVLTIMTASEY